MKVNITQLARELQGLDKPFIMLMIGAPGSGKSTVLARLAERDIKFHVASTDNLLEAYAQKKGITYAQAHQKADFKGIKREMTGGMMAAFVRRDNVVNDQTNMASKKRRTTLEPAPRDYIRIGLMFDCSTEELERRLAARAATTGKFVSMGVVREMFKSYSTPSKAEGFNHLWTFEGDPR
jgi:predicted kinase